MKYFYALILLIIGLLIFTYFNVTTNKSQTVDESNVPITNTLSKPVVNYVTKVVLSNFELNNSEWYEIGLNQRYHFIYKDLVENYDDCIVQNDIVLTCISNEKFEDYRQFAIYDSQLEDIIYAYELVEPYSYLLGKVALSGEPRIVIYLDDTKENALMEVRNETNGTYDSQLLSIELATGLITIK